MPIPVLSNFPMDQVAPWIRARQISSQANLQQQQARAANIQNDFLRRSLQEALKKESLTNELLSAQANISPELARAQLEKLSADIALEKLKTNYPLLSMPGIGGMIGALQYGQENIKGFDNQTFGIGSEQKPINPEQYQKLADAINSMGGHAVIPSEGGGIGEIPLETGIGMLPQESGLGEIPPETETGEEQTQEQISDTELTKEQLRNSIMQNVLSQQQEASQLPQTPQNVGMGSYGDILKNYIMTELKAKSARTRYYETTPTIRAATSKAALSAAGTDENAAKRVLTSIMDVIDPNAKITPKMIRAFKEFSANTAAKQEETTATANMMTFAINATEIMKEIDENIDAYASFFSPQGKANLLLQKSLNAMGAPLSDEYKKYLKVKTDLEFLTQESKRELGVQATDQASKIFHDILAPSEFITSPEVTKERYNAVKKILKGHIAKSLSTGIKERKSILKKEAEEYLNLPEGGTKTNRQKQTGNIIIEDDTGRRMLIPSQNESAAIKKGYKVIR